MPTIIDWALRKDVLEIFLDLKNNMNCAMLLITHDIPVAEQLGDRVAVMYAGEIVELGPSKAVLDSPMHPYTRGLIASRPCNGFKTMDGYMPSFTALPPGCRFSDRCRFATDECTKSDPELREATDGRWVRCLKYGGALLSGGQNNA